MMMASGSITHPSLHSNGVLRRRFPSCPPSRAVKLPLCVRASKEDIEPSSSSTQIKGPSSNVNFAPPRRNPDLSSSVQLGSQPPSSTVAGNFGVYERLFSNLNEANLQHEPGSLTSAILLIAGTTIGAGILAIPAVTQEAGFLASGLTCIVSWLYMVTTGLLIAEVNVSTMCELGSGGVSLVSMAMRTLGRRGVLAACVSYLFIHYALLVAYIARSSEILTVALDVPQWLCAAVFSGAFGGLCYFGSQRVVGAVNGFLVAGIIGSFGLLTFAAAGDLNWGALLRANFEAVPQSIPIIALSFVYQNVVPVVCTSLEGDLKRIRSAVVWGTFIPLVMFLVWDAVVLGSLSGITQSEDPLAALRSENGVIGCLHCSDCCRQPWHGMRGMVTPAFLHHLGQLFQEAGWCLVLSLQGLAMLSLQSSSLQYS